MSKKKEAEEIKSPSLIYLASEVSRSMLELAWFYTSTALLPWKKNGDGHPVMVLPGFMASDNSTAPMRRHLKETGYTPYGWGLGRNKGSEESLNALVKKIETLYELHNQRISLIGWSLGGVYARELAKIHPDMIRQVITMGSPFAGVDESNHATWLYKIISGGKEPKEAEREQNLKFSKAPPVPVTAIYSKSDGIVPWQVCIEKEEKEIYQNVRVIGSHIGLGHNPMVIQIIRNRLTQTRKNWSRFTSNQLHHILLNDGLRPVKV